MGCYVYLKGYFWIFLLFVFIANVSMAKLPEIHIVKTTAVSPRKITLSWKPSHQLKKGNLKYIVRFKEDNTRFKRLMSSQPRITLKDLVPDVSYTIAVRSIKGKERGEWSKSVTVKTLPRTAAASGTRNIEGKVELEAIGTKSARLSWTLNVDQDQINHFKSYRVVWKNKKKRQEEELTIQTVALRRLEPNTRYMVNVYLLTTSGEKTKIGNLKIITRQEQIVPPKNFRLKAIADTTIEVKWRRLDRDNSDSPVTGYVVEYKRRGNGDLDTCTVETNKTGKVFKFEGLLPETRYALRLAGKFDNVTGPYSDWLKAKTEPFESNRTSIRIFHITSTEILVVWEPNDGYTFRVIDVFNTDNSLRSHVYYKEMGNETSPESALFINELDPDTGYKLVITESTSFANYRTQLCLRRQTTVFTTGKGTCDTVCTTDDGTFSADIKGQFYDPYLRLLPLPGQRSNLITWSTYVDYTSNSSYFYVIKILGEPFLSHLHSYFIPNGQTYHVTSDLDPDKPYSINLAVFDSEIDTPLFTSEFLIVIPDKDMPVSITVDGEQNTLVQGSVSSMDLYREADSLTDEEMRTLSMTEDIVIQTIDELNVTVISKTFPEDKFDTVGTLIPQNHTLDGYQFLNQEEPEVYPIANVTMEEGTMADITCLSRGDPYPIITWINLTANESIGNMNSILRVFITLSKYVGSTQATDSRAFLGVKSFLTIQNITLTDSGQYACAAENSAGIDMRVFQVTVLPEPPTPVLNLVSSAPTPFDIRVSWLPPHQSRDRKSISPVTGYRLVLLDEHDVTMATKNSTETHSVFENLRPKTTYKILVFAYHKYGESKSERTEAKTRRIPILGPAENVTVDTLNSTIVRITWEHPIAVSTNQIRLRNYIIHLRKDGDRKSEERKIDKNTTEVIFKGLTAEHEYELRIIGMSEDGQVSYSEWIQASTHREAYMDESRPPPPPYNVYLRPEGGNVIVSWLPPRNDDNIIVRGYAITVFNNKTKRESMEVDYEESSVIIYEVDMGVIYQISVQTTNKAGKSVEQWQELYIPEIRVTDEPVENFRGRGVSSTNVQLQWDAPGTGAYTHFVLSYINTAGEQAKLPGSGKLPAHVRNYVVKSLTPFTEYLFTITPFFKRMEGNDSNLTMKTLSDRPSHPPENVVLTSFNSTAILIECQPPSVGKNGVIITYKVSYRTKRTWRNDVIFPAEEDESLNSYVTGLLPSTTYEFRVRALTINGSGPWSDWQQIRTKAPDPIIPKVPRNLTCNATTTSIKVTWEPPDQDISHITGYVLGYGKFIPEVYRASVTKDTNIHVVDNLESGAMYIISVRSFNEYGESAAVFDVVSTET